MGFWSSLAKGLALGGAAIAAPFTGGASLATVLPAVAAAGGAVINAAGSAATQNRTEQGQRSLIEDQLRMQQERDAANAGIAAGNLELGQRGDAREAQLNAYKNALRSALAMHMKDVNFDTSGFNAHVPKLSFAGGARPSAIGAEGGQAAAILNRLALEELMHPKGYTAPPQFQRTPIQDMPKASFWEKLAGPVGMGLNLIGNLPRLNDPTVRHPTMQGNAGGYSA